MKIDKLTTISTLVAIVVIVTSYIVIYAYNQKTDYAPTQISYIIDIENTSARIGFADYVFVGEVVKVVGTEYRHYALNDKGKPIRKTGSHYTEYKVKVIENIKGDLGVDREITVYQAGGKLEHSRSGDDLMQTGNTYIIETCVQDDGSLLADGDNCNTQLDVHNIEELHKNQQYLSYLEDANNEIPYERERSEFTE